MRNTISVLFILIFSGTFAQKAMLKKADKLFAERSYVKAAAMYEQLPRNAHVLQHLGDAYFFNAQMENAVKAYADLYAIPNNTVDDLYLFRYSQALMGLSQYSKADSLMSKYKGYTVDTSKFTANLELNLPFSFQVRVINSESQNGAFGLTFIGEKAVFSNYGNVTSAAYNWNDKPYLDLYEATLTENDVLANVQPLPEIINSKQHESNPTFTKDGNTMYFNRTAEIRKRSNGEKVAHVKIMKAVRSIDGLWQVTETPFSSDDYSCEHPCLSKDDKKIYFSSDMPGSVGGFDLYVVAINDDGSYGKPINLGPAVNTKYREQFPVISEDGQILYFASDGHQGFGGLDLFSSHLTNSGFSKAVNLGPTLNSGMDDFAFVFKPGTDTGFFSSNRTGADDLYHFVRTYNQKAYFVEGDIKDKETKELLPGTKVSLYDENGNLVAQVIAGQAAEYHLGTKPNTKYRLEAVRDFYIPYSEYFITNNEGKLHYSIELLMQRYDQAEKIITKEDDGRTQIKLENIYFDSDDWKIKAKAAKVLNVLVDLLKKYPDMEIELGAHTDSRANDDYNLRLSHKRAAAAVGYLVENGIAANRLQYRGYGETMPKIKCGKKCSKKQHAVNRRCEFVILK